MDTLCDCKIFMNTISLHYPQRIFPILPSPQYLPHRKTVFCQVFGNLIRKIFLLYNEHLEAGLSTNAAKLFLPLTFNGQIFEKYQGVKCKFSVNSRWRINHNVQVLYCSHHPKRTNFHRTTICSFVNFL